MLRLACCATLLGCAAAGCTSSPAPPPAWEGAGLIAFVSDREGVDALYVMRDDGTQVRRLTTTLPPVSHPSWSADGRRLAFNAGPPTTSALYVIDVGGPDAGHP